MTFQGSNNRKGKPKSSNSGFVSQNSKGPHYKDRKEDRLPRNHGQASVPAENAKTLTLSERKKQPESESEHPRWKCVSILVVISQGVSQTITLVENTFSIRVCTVLTPSTIFYRYKYCSLKPFSPFLSNSHFKNCITKPLTCQLTLVLRFSTRTR